MTDRNDLEHERPPYDRDPDRVLREWFAEVAPTQEPPVLLPAVLARTALTRRRPAWRTRDWWAGLLGPRDRRIRNMTLVTGTAASAVALVLSFVLVTGLTDDGTPRTPDMPGGQTHTVAADSSADFDSIAAAVDAATDGDTILIAPGTYAGSVIIDKDIVILGDADDSSEVIVGIAADSPSVELIEWSTRYGFWVQGGDVEIGNLTITGPGEGVTALLVTGHLNLHDVVESFDIYTARPYLFIDMREEAGGTFRDNETKAALRISGSAAPLVENNDVFNTIANTEESAARIVGNRIGGLSVSDSATPWIEGNEIDFTNNGSSYGDVIVCAVEMTGPGAAPTVVSNVIRNAELGICPEMTTRAVVEGNRLIDNITGLSLRRTEGEFRDNEISGGETGIRVWVSGSPVFTGNTVTGASISGFFVASNTSPVLSGNVLCGNARDLTIAGGAEPVVEDDNEICDQDPATE